MSIKSQLTFSSQSACRKFIVNKAKLNMKNSSVSCVECHHVLSDHSPDAVEDEDVVVYLNHLEAKSGANPMYVGSNGATVFLGGKGASVDPFVTQNTIKAVVNASNLHLSSRSDFKKWAQAVVDLEKKGVIEVLRLDWDDENDQKLWRNEPFDQLRESIEFVDRHLKEGHNVVIHCAQGKSRSGSVLVAFMMAKKGMTYEEALAYGKSKRNILQPNDGFERQLKEFQKSEVLANLRTSLGE